MSQPAIGTRPSMNHSEVSRLERSGDMRLTTLRSYIEALGGWLRRTSRAAAAHETEPRIDAQDHEEGSRR
jgi:hypothetical protein